MIVARALRCRNMVISGEPDYTFDDLHDKLNGWAERERDAQRGYVDEHGHFFTTESAATHASVFGRSDELAELGGLND